MLGTLIFSTTPTNRNIAQSATCSPVAAAILAEMAGLGETIVIVVAKLGVQRLTTRASHDLIWWFQAALLESALGK
jgi:hypothetical protein